MTFAVELQEAIVKAILYGGVALFCVCAALMVVWLFLVTRE